MNFIKQNLFLVVLAAIVLVVGGALVGLNLMSFSDSLDAEIAKREALSQSLQRFQRDKEINAKLVNAQKDHVTTVRKAAEEVTKDQNQKDKAANLVLKLDVVENGVVKETVDSFPYDAKKYIEAGLTLLYINKHRAEANDLLTQLKITYLPNKEDIDAEARNIQARQRNATTEADLKAFAAQAVTTLTASRAAKGYLYCDDNSISQQITFGSKEQAADDKTLWSKQVKLWVAQDVLSAIKAANEEATAKLDAGQRNVTTAAVKHLLAMEIVDTYFCKAAPVAGPVAPNAAAAAQKEAVSPTQRQCCKEYDVVNYSFSVVMPTRFVQLLQQKLMENRYHTVLQVKMEDINTKKELADYYYGNDPVMLITFTNEFLMLTSWERDLMPASFLQTLPDSIKRAPDLARGKSTVKK